MPYCFGICWRLPTWTADGAVATIADIDRHFHRIRYLLAVTNISGALATIADIDWHPDRSRYLLAVANITSPGPDTCWRLPT